MSELTIAQRLRCAYVKRWHMVRTLREQNLAEHMMLVQMVALEATDRYLAGPEYRKDPRELRLNVMEWAMWHDMPEVVTGDIPTPTKDLMARAGAAGVLATIERGVDARYAALEAGIGETAKLIVAFADLYEAIHFLHWEGHGPRADEIKRGLTRQMADYICHAENIMMVGLAKVFAQMFEDMVYDSNE